MGKIGNGYGSEWHLLRFLGRHPRLLNSAVSECCGGGTVEWLDFPSGAGGKAPESEWRGLDFLPVGNPAHQEWRERWPQSGNVPNWDAVGLLAKRGASEWLLVEAKAHVEELKSICRAKAAESRSRIEAFLNDAKCRLGASADADWTGECYQYANRLAVLDLLDRHEVRARLIFIYFLGDQSPKGDWVCPRTRQEWEAALRLQNELLGLPEEHPLSDRIHNLFVDVANGAVSPHAST